MIGKLTVDKVLFNVDIGFYINNNLIYKGIKKKSVFIINSPVGLEEMRIEKRTRWFKSIYTIYLTNGESAEVKKTGGLKINYECVYRNQSYYLYGHKGLKTSIFLNQSQIGYIEKAKKAYSGRKNYEVVMNSGINTLLICGFALIINDDDFSGTDDANSISYDLGNFGPEEFPFNENWKPSL
jgi:uncharacterized protein YxjI